MITPAQLRLTARHNHPDAALLNGAADRIEYISSQLEATIGYLGLANKRIEDLKAQLGKPSPIPTIEDAYRELKGKSLRISRKFHVGRGYYYKSHLGYLCYKPNKNPRSVGHAICTIDEFNAYNRKMRGNL